MRPVSAVLVLLAAHGGPALLPGQTPDSTRTFSSTHIDSTRIYYTQVVYHPPRVDTLIDTLWCTVTGCRDAPPPVPGVPFGPIALWKGGEPQATPIAFTASQNYVSPDLVVPMITRARAAGQSLILALTGGATSQYTTNGAFDLAKWQRRIDQYNTGPIR